MKYNKHEDAIKQLSVWLELETANCRKRIEEAKASNDHSIVNSLEIYGIRDRIIAYTDVLLFLAEFGVL